LVQANIHKHEFNEVTLVWGLLGLAPNYYEDTCFMGHERKPRFHNGTVMVNLDNNRLVEMTTSWRIEICKHFQCNHRKQRTVHAQ